MANEFPNRTGVLLDPDPLWMAAVEEVLSKLGVTVVGKATRAERALELVREHRPDLLVTELDFLREGGRIASLHDRGEEAHDLTIIVLSSSADGNAIREAFDLGVAAYVVKTAEPEDLATAIRQDSIYMNDRVLDTPVRKVRNGHVPGLTVRELQILRLVADGHSNAQLARMLWVTEQTVKFHLSNIYRKLNVTNRTEASRWAQTNGVLRDDDEQSEPAGRSA